MVGKSKEVYVIEVKFHKAIADLEKALSEAAEQIGKKKYALKFQGTGWKVYKTAIQDDGEFHQEVAANCRNLSHKKLIRRKVFENVAE
jgi:hypothetical protein